MKVYVYNKQGTILYDTFIQVNRIDEFKEQYVLYGIRNNQRYVATVDKRTRMVKLFANGY